MENKTFSIYARELTPEQIEKIKENIIDYEFYIRCVQHSANKVLRERGFLLLGEILENLGVRVEHKRELICGWVYAPEDKNHNGDNFVDIEYIVLDNGNVMLDFNVDGNILDYFKD